MILEALGVLGVLVELYFVLWLVGQCPTTTTPPKGGTVGENNGKNCSIMYFWDNNGDKDDMVLHSIHAGH